MEAVEAQGAENPARGVLANDLRHVDTRRREAIRKPLCGRRLSFVVALLDEALAHLADQLREQGVRRQPPGNAENEPQVLLDAISRPRVLELHRQVAAVVRPRAVNLAEAGGSKRPDVESSKTAVRRLAELAPEDLQSLGFAHRRNVIVRPGELRRKRLWQ